MGKPDQKDLNENMAATQGLSHMITDCKKLFQVGGSGVPAQWEVLVLGRAEWDGSRQALTLEPSPATSWDRR